MSPFEYDLNSLFRSAGFVGKINTGEWNLGDRGLLVFVFARDLIMVVLSLSSCNTLWKTGKLNETTFSTKPFRTSDKYGPSHNIYRLGAIGGVVSMIIIRSATILDQRPV